MTQIVEIMTFFFSHRKDFLTILSNSRSFQQTILKLPWTNENENKKKSKNNNKYLFGVTKQLSSYFDEACFLRARIRKVWK